MTDTSAFETFERMAEKIAQLEAEAEAGAEIQGELAEGERLRQRFAELEAGSVEHHLLELKAKVGALPAGEQAAQKSLPEGAPQNSVEDELAALKAKIAVDAKKK